MMIAMVLLRAAIFTAELLLHMYPFIVLGIIIAEFIVNLGIVNKISILAKPVINFSHLKKEYGASFLMAFASPPAADAMLAEYYEKKLITKKEMFLAAMINSSISININDFFYIVPVLIPLLGVTGLEYALIFLLIGFVQAGILMVASRLMLKRRHEVFEDSMKKKERICLADAFTQSLKGSIPTIKRITLTIVPALFVTCILIEAEVFDALASYISGVSYYLPIPPAGLGIITALFGNFIAACAVASSLLSAGLITGREVILTLLIGNVLTSIVTAFKTIMPYYVGIFGFRPGLELTAIFMAIWNATIITFIAVLMLF
ncbi:MAG: nucleoside recognition protein [Deltaproteobacteria bacterium]|nr:MAG: nucleoside recognition protein [Deltaproteobacteria bacterium]